MKMKSFLAVFFAVYSVGALACMEYMQRFAPFGKSYFDGNTFEFYSGGLILDGDLIYFDSDKKSWMLVPEGSDQATKVGLSDKITITHPFEREEVKDENGKVVTKPKVMGTVNLGSPTRDAKTGKWGAKASITPRRNPEVKGPPPEMFFESSTFSVMEDNGRSGIGHQKITTTNGSNVIHSTLEVEKMGRTRGFNKTSSQESVLDLSSAEGQGHYHSGGCGKLNKSDSHSGDATTGGHH